MKQTSGVVDLGKQDRGDGDTQWGMVSRPPSVASPCLATPDHSVTMRSLTPPRRQLASAETGIMLCVLCCAGLQIPVAEEKG